MPALLFALWSLPSLAFSFCYATTLNSWRGGQSNLLYLLPLRKAFQPLFTQKQFSTPFPVSIIYSWAKVTTAECCVWALTTATTGLELSHLPKKYFFFFLRWYLFFSTALHFQLIFVLWSTWVTEVLVGSKEFLVFPLLALLLGRWQTLSQPPTQLGAGRICTSPRNCWQQTLIVMETA